MSKLTFSSKFQLFNVKICQYLKNPIFLPKKVLSEKWDFFRSKSVRIKFFSKKKKKKNFKKNLP